MSEDLDFAGGAGFRREDLKGLSEVLTERLSIRYELPVLVSEPKRSGGRVSTWKLRIETRPEQRHLPAQRIQLDIRALPSYDVRPMVLRNLYEVDLGTSGLILRAESREEILADKLVALAFRENRLKSRDLWDIGWLAQRGVELPAGLIPKKIADHGRMPDEFADRLSDRIKHLESEQARTDFLMEMRRFLPSATVESTLSQDGYWQWLRETVIDLSRTVL